MLQDLGLEEMFALLRVYKSVQPRVPSHDRISSNTRQATVGDAVQRDSVVDGMNAAVARVII